MCGLQEDFFFASLCAMFVAAGTRRGLRALLVRNRLFAVAFFSPFLDNESQSERCPACSVREIHGYRLRSMEEEAITDFRPCLARWSMVHKPKVQLGSSDGTFRH
jgi:hypothetical protein